MWHFPPSDISDPFNEESPCGHSCPKINMDWSFCAIQDEYGHFYEPDTTLSFKVRSNHVILHEDSQVEEASADDSERGNQQTKSSLREFKFRIL